MSGEFKYRSRTREEMRARMNDEPPQIKFVDLLTKASKRIWVNPVYITHIVPYEDDETHCVIHLVDRSVYVVKGEDHYIVMKICGELG
jgi:hypothetical protein